MDALLDYAVATYPPELQASPRGGTPVTCSLRIVASNPRPASPVTLEGLEVLIPYGAAAADLTGAPRAIAPVPPAGWAHVPATDSNVFAFTPPGGAIQVGADSVVITLDGVRINSEPGTVEGLLMYEGRGGCRPPGCPRADLSGKLVKQPSGWGEISFSAPSDIDLGQAVELTWWGPPSATYAIHWDDAGGRQSIPATGAPALGPSGTYPGHADPPLEPQVTTTFTLSVTETVAGVPYSKEVQATVSVLQPLPTIELFTGVVSHDRPGSESLGLHWKTNTGSAGGWCTLLGDQSLLAPSSTDDGYSIALDTPQLPRKFDLTASNLRGSVTAGCSLEWSLASRVKPLPYGTAPDGMPFWDSPGLAVSDDGTRLYAGTSNGWLTAFALDLDPRTAPQPAAEAQVGGVIDLVAAAGPPVAGGARPVWVGCSNGDQGTQLFGVLDSGDALRAGNPVVPPFGGSQGFDAGENWGLGVNGTGTVLYHLGMGYDANLYLTAYSLDPANLRLTQGAYMQFTRDDWHWLAVAGDGTVYLSSGNVVLVYKPPAAVGGQLVQTGSSPALADKHLTAIAVAGDYLAATVDKSTQLSLFQRSTWNHVADLDVGGCGQALEPGEGGLGPIAMRSDTQRIFLAPWDNETQWLCQFAPAVTGGVPPS